MTKRGRYTIYIVVGMAAILAALWLFAGGGADMLKLRDVEHTATIENVPPRIFPETIPEAEQENIDLPQTFRHPTPAFSFSYPAGFTAKVLDSPEGGQTIVVQNSERKAGFQIHLEPYDDPDTEITAARLARDIPEMKIKEPQDVLIGGNQISPGNLISAGRGLAWIAEDSGTREIWFIFRGTLYQITAPMENDTLLQRVLSTWTFQ